MTLCMMLFLLTMHLERPVLSSIQLLVVAVKGKAMAGYIVIAAVQSMVPYVQQLLSGATNDSM